MAQSDFAYNEAVFKEFKKNLNKAIEVAKATQSDEWDQGEYAGLLQARGLLKKALLEKGDPIEKPIRDEAADPPSAE